MNYNKSKLSILNSKKAILHLLGQKKINFDGVLSKLEYDSALESLQIDLIKVQRKIANKGHRLLIIIEGGEFAGKSDLIRVLTDHLNPRSIRSVALPKPTVLEKHQWYFRRYVNQLPQKGEIVIFDRSWYNRAVLEPVNGFCSKEEYSGFMSEVNYFEKLIGNKNLTLFKLYLKVSKKEQALRLENVKKNPLRYWELTEVDRNAQRLWNDFKKYEKKMLNKTNTKENPWIILNADDKKHAQLEALRYIIKSYNKIQD